MGQAGVACCWPGRLGGILLSLGLADFGPPKLTVPNVTPYTRRQRLELRGEAAAARMGRCLSFDEEFAPHSSPPLDPW